MYLAVSSLDFRPKNGCGIKFAFGEGLKKLEEKVMCNIKGVMVEGRGKKYQDVKYVLSVSVCVYTGDRWISSVYLVVVIGSSVGKIIIKDSYQNFPFDIKEHGLNFNPQGGEW